MSYIKETLVPASTRPTPPKAPLLPRPVGKGNFAPVADDEIATVEEDSYLGMSVSTLLAGDTDRNSSDVLSIVDVKNATHGTAYFLGSEVQFLPEHNFTGTATFEYTLSDGVGGTDTGLVTINVTGTNDSPIANGVTGYAVEGGSPVTLRPLENASDPDGDPLSIVGLPAVLPDGVTFNPATNTFTFDPSHPSYQYLIEGQGGGALVQFEISDGKPYTWFPWDWPTNSSYVAFNVTGVGAPEPGNVVRDDPAISQALSGTAAAKDYFVFDMSVGTRTFVDAIYGFEYGLDELVFVNINSDSGIYARGSNGYGVLDASWGLPGGDPALADSSIGYRSYDPATGQYSNGYIFVVDAQLPWERETMVTGDPFLP